MCGALTGFEDVPAVDPEEPEEPVCPGFLSVGLLSGVGAAFGRLLLGLVAVPEFAGLSFGREVRNAPRTSSLSCRAGAATPAITAQRQTNAKTMTLNRIYRISLLLTC